MHSLISNKKNGISDLCRRFNVSKLEVFGSAASQTDFDGTQSDADFVVEFFRPARLNPLDEYFGLRAGLSSLLGIQVDLIELSAVKNPYIRKSIEQGRELVFAA